jgi:futalosine hydrolase
LGWKHWNGVDGEVNDLNLRASITDTIQLTSPPIAQQTFTRLQLLSVAAASGNYGDAEQKMKHYPNAIAEDMEGFSVAAACHLTGVRLHIVRGISNQAGDRDHKNWQVHEAMTSAASMTDNILSLELEAR